MKIIGAGQGRTGTTSLRAALVELGLKTYHMDEVFDNGVDHLKVWHDAATGTPSQLIVSAHVTHRQANQLERLLCKL